MPTAGVEGRAYAAAQFDGSNDTLTVANASRTVAEYFYDFEGSAGSSWSRTDPLDNAQGQPQLPGQFGNQAVTLTLSNLPTHDQVDIEYDLYVIKTWDGNDTRMPAGRTIGSGSVDGAQQLRTTFINADPPYN